MQNRGSDAIDFYLFWLVGQSAGDVRDPWSEEGRRALAEKGAKAQTDAEASPGMRAAARHTSLETTATPLLYASFAALSTGDYEVDYALYHLVSLACVSFAVLLLAISFGWPPWAVFLALAALLAAFPPLASDAWVGNVNQIQLAGLALLIVLARLPRGPVPALASGAVAALLFLFKPNLVLVEALLLALWVARRHWRFAGLHLAAGAAVAALAIAGSSALFGGAPWTAWLRAASGLAGDTGLSAAAGNLSLSHAVGASAGWANAAVAVVGLISLGLAWVGRDAVDAEVGAACAGVAGPLLFGTLAWEHYFVLLTPALLYFLRPADARLRAAGVCALALVGAVPHLATSPRAIALSMGAGAALLLVASWSLLVQAATNVMSSFLAGSSRCSS